MLPGRAAVSTPMVGFTSFHTVFGGFLTSGWGIKVFYTAGSDCRLRNYFCSKNLAWDMSIPNQCWNERQHRWSVAYQDRVVAVKHSYPILPNSFKPNTIPAKTEKSQPRIRSECEGSLASFVFFIHFILKVTSDICIHELFSPSIMSNGLTSVIYFPSLSD